MQGTEQLSVSEISRAEVKPLLEHLLRAPELLRVAAPASRLLVSSRFGVPVATDAWSRQYMVAVLTFGAPFTLGRTLIWNFKTYMCVILLSNV